MTTSTLQLRVSLLNITLLTLLAAVALCGTVAAGFALIGDDGPLRALMSRPVYLGLTILLIVELVYLGFAVHVGARQVRAGVLCRYALKLQLQSFMEMFAGSVLTALLGVACYTLAGLAGVTEEQNEMLAFATSQRAWVIYYAIALSMPALSMMTGAWRLHGLSSTPGAVADAADGSLFRRELAMSADADELRRMMAALLGRLTDRTAPGLNRPWYTPHPRVVLKEEGGQQVYELVWTNCPMKLLVRLQELEDGRHHFVAQSVLRGGIHSVELFPVPVEALAQMQYIDTNLLAPLQTQLAMRATERQRDALRQRAVETQLRILQAQIEPHFLFNTLANVRHLYRSSIEAGEDMLDHLIAYLRSAMDDLRAEDSTVVREMDLAMHYLAIMKIRMGERLSYRFILPDELLEHPFPPAMLISLVENAIKHGIAGSERGEIVLSASRQDGQLRLRVADNGAGLSSVGGTGVGLANIRQRLEAMFGSAAWLEVGAEPGAGFTATIVIPLQERKE